MTDRQSTGMGTDVGRARRNRGDGVGGGGMGGGFGGGGAGWVGATSSSLLDARATEFALECEGRGMRTGHDELRDLFAGCTLPPTTSAHRGAVVDGAADDADRATPTSSSSAGGEYGPRTPRSRTGTWASAAGGRRPTGRDASAALGCPSAQDDDYTVGSNSLLLATDSSIGGIFESTNRECRRNNHVVGSRRVPPPNVAALNVTNAARLAALRCFDGEASDDGEDDHSDRDFIGGGGSGGGGGANNRHPVLDTPATPIRSDRMVQPSSTSSPRRSAFGDDGVIIEQSLWPVVIVFRRTVQRRRLLGPGGMGWGNPGLSLKGSLFGIPSFRMDDECDRAASLIRQLASSGRKAAGGGGVNVPMDIFCQGDDGINDMGDNASHSPTIAPDGKGGEDIEASTIRGMIDSAVGLGFVRLSKVVVGVSLQGGSGILISRLTDGTWSAPSAIGVLGLGVGLQFGLEVCDFVFIIQTTEGMDHFKRGGNFVVGGNIGAAVANCGREAYGAAILGICTGAMPLDDEIKPTNKTDGNNRVEVRSAPMIAYAKSQGLYFGVSVDGLKFFTRNDINSRTYKFSMSSEMPAKDILDGLVLPPPEVRSCC
jgi:lipid-binding SYLF domain-containing protein